MTPRITFATAGRVLSQIRHDRRTLALLLFMPSILLALLWWIFEGGRAFDRIGPALLALFPFVSMFLVTSIATLRERTSGTLERLLAMPTRKLDFLLGYALAFGLMAILQAGIAAGISIGLLDMDLVGPTWLVVSVAVLDALLGVALGLFVSAFAATEFQVVQFMPAIVLPQVLLCGLFVARNEMPSVLSAISDVLPLSYAVDAMTEVQTNPSPDVWGYAAIIVAFAIGLLALGAATLRRRTA